MTSDQIPNPVARVGILERIVAHKRAELVSRRQVAPLADVRNQAEQQPRPRHFEAALRSPRCQRLQGSGPGVALIAEVKKASPSKGLLRADFNPIGLAQIYAAHGAQAISVLTDEHFFQGHLDDLTAVRGAVLLPCLRKDFLFDPYQVYEARAAGADAVLLITAILERRQLHDLQALAWELGMAALVEVHDEWELETAMSAEPRIIGINNRNLQNFDVDLNVTLRLRPSIPGGTIVVAESGIHTRDDVRCLADAGVDAILVGEALVVAEDVGAKVQELSNSTCLL